MPKIKFIFAGFSFLLLLLPADTNAITWCHDYSLYKISGKDVNKTSPQMLRQNLARMKFKRFNFTHAAHLPQAQSKLKPGDVIVIGNAHSGVVNQQGLIDHFIQKFGASGTSYKPEDILNMSNFKRSWTLLQIMNFTRTTPDGRKIFPYKKQKVEVWRKQN